MWKYGSDCLYNFAEQRDAYILRFKKQTKVSYLVFYFKKAKGVSR